MSFFKSANQSINYDTVVRTIDGKDSTLEPYAGKVMLIVNTASKCGFTPQYQGLEALWRELGDRGLVILGFPCDQFGHQEPGDEGAIASFCELNFGVSFPLHSKVEVNGRGAHPLFQQLKAAAPGLLGSEAIKWNFTKFMVGRDGKILSRFAPNDTPEQMRAAIVAALDAA